tara:strand:- start:504 stop:884 length:381 start_codon:yes stop_codon:yes gene_type:complete
MKEIISFSLGKHSNHIATHNWNAFDESLKVQPAEGETQTYNIQEGTDMIYHETTNSKELLPRHIFVDFNDNFGNYSACFYGHDKADKKAIEEQNYGQFEVDEPKNDEVLLSFFQSELLNIDEMYNY